MFRNIRIRRTLSAFALALAAMAYLSTGVHAAEVTAVSYTHLTLPTTPYV